MGVIYEAAGTQAGRQPEAAQIRGLHLGSPTRPTKKRFTEDLSVAAEPL